MKAFLTHDGVAVETDTGTNIAVNLTWDSLFTSDDPFNFLTESLESGRAVARGELVAPLQGQEVWAAGVTYIRSRSARMAEAEAAGGGSFYDHVYTAKRPELFFKGTRSRVVGPNHQVRVRSDSKWSVPEPELALAITSKGKVFGYTIGNDMSARDIEGENPLYLPQAKVYAGSCALGPGVVVTRDPLPRETEISIQIVRNGENIFSGNTTLSSMKRTAEELVAFLFQDNIFPEGCYLLTGTGIVPPDEFALQSGDEISITIEPIGTLLNRVA